MGRVLAESGPDAGLVWHLGDPLGEQRRLARGEAAVVLSHRPVLEMAGADRCRYLDLVATRRFDPFPGPGFVPAYLLDAQGHILFGLAAAQSGETVLIWTEPGQGEALAAWLDKNRFRLDVTVTPRPDLAVTWSGRPALAPEASPAVAPAWWSGFGVAPADGAPEPTAGTWAFEALRIAAGVARTGLDTDGRTIANELGVPSAAVELNRGCYPGQETVARVYNLGQPPRRLVRLHFDGSAETLPAPGTPLLAPDGGQAGLLGSAAYHHELGPIGLALVKRNTDDTAGLTAGGLPAAVEPLVDKDAGLHFRPGPTALPRRL
jgi:folate-binding protein YgfZ